MRDDCMVIFHKNCADGFGAAWATRQAFGDTGETYVPAAYGDPPPNVTGKNVYIVDFSYKRPVLLEMAKVAETITIIDHHKTAVEDLINLPANVDAVFDMDHSGAILTWRYFFDDKPPPVLLQHIEDRDLWRFKLPYTREIQATIFSYPYDFKVWDELMQRPIDSLIMEGNAIERKHHKDIGELLAVTMRYMRIGGHTVPVANLPYVYSSEAGHVMAHNQPFAACYWDTPKGRVFSLRSNGDGLDVSEIAKQYGGGGHRAAAGFTVDFETAKQFEV